MEPICDRCCTKENLEEFNECPVCGPIILCKSCADYHRAEISVEEN